MPARVEGNMKVLAAAVLLCVLPQYVFGLPNGAPQSACITLMPVHPGAEPPQNSASPYTVTANKLGETYRVTISSPSGKDFVGFVLQARYSKDQKVADGKFLARKGVTKTIDCFGEQNTLTHEDTSSKSQVVTEWTPSANMNDDIIFRATVAATYYQFWTGIDSEPIRVIFEASAPDVPSSEDKTIHERKKQEKNIPNIYENCFITKGCFGLPLGCIQNTDCEILLSYAQSSDGIVFHLSGIVKPENYIAMALSMDQKMGDDTVKECILQENDVAAVLRESWNEKNENMRSRELPGNEYISQLKNGIVSCEWTTALKFEASGFNFDLKKSTYYLFLAKGPLSNGKLSYHSGKVYSQDPVNFTVFEALEGGKTSDSIKIHGTFMVTAWVGLVSIAILFARHFKSAFETQTLCGVKIWFAMHRGLMIIALILVQVAVIVIFVHKNGWNYSTKNPHAIFGCIAIILGMSQPCMAAFRPAPDHAKRPIFNWLHWIVGNTAQIFAVIAIFFAVSLQSSGLKDNFYWVMAVYVIGFLIFHFLFQLQVWTSEKKRNSDIKMNELSRGGRISKNMQTNLEEKNQTVNMLKIFLLGMFIIFIVVILVALYVLIGIA